MIATTAKVLDQTSDSALILLEPPLVPIGCSNCVKSCGVAKRVTATLPGNYPSSFELSLSLHDQLFLLLHSILFPLMGFVIGGSLGEWIGAGDLVVASCALVGLFVGTKLCKQQSADRLNINEIEDE